MSGRFPEVVAAVLGGDPRVIDVAGIVVVARDGDDHLGSLSVHSGVFTNNRAVPQPTLADDARVD